MADKNKIPNIYQQASEMEMGAGGKGAPPGGPGGGGTPPVGEPGKPGTPAGQSGEKVKNVQVLLDVFKKMDSQEQDPALKDMIRQMSDIAEQYMSKLGGSTQGMKPPTGEPETPAKAAEGAPPPGPGGPGGPGGGAPEATPVPA